MVTTTTGYKPTARGSKPTVHKAAKQSSRVTMSRKSGGVGRSTIKIGGAVPDVGHRYFADEIDQQRQDHASNDTRHYDDDEDRDEFPMESYFGEARIPVLSTHSILPYPNTDAPGIEGDLHNLMIYSNNSWDALNQNDSFGFDFNKGGEMSLSFESHDYTVLETPAVTESMDGSIVGHQQQIDWTTAAPQIDTYGNLIPPTSLLSSSMGVGDGNMRDENVEEDPYAYAFGCLSANNKSTKKSSSRKETRKGDSFDDLDGEGSSKNKKIRGGRKKKRLPLRASSSEPNGFPSKGGRSNLGVPHLPPGIVSGDALLTTETGITLTRDQAPGIGWSLIEDMALQDIMGRHKSPVDWEVVAKQMNLGRTPRECHDRWTRYLKPGTRKGQWREDEDAMVLKVIASSPEETFTQWADLAPFLPGRTGKQIRDRWVNYLNPAINHLPFSREDDLKLWAGHSELGKRWVEISVKIFNSTRSENHIKNRWYSAAFKKFIVTEYGSDAYVEASPSLASPSFNTVGSENAPPTEAAGTAPVTVTGFEEI